MAMLVHQEDRGDHGPGEEAMDPAECVGVSPTRLDRNPNPGRNIVKRILRRSFAATTAGAATLLAFCLAVSPTSAQVTFGSLSNFDVINDTGQPCNGFEIELEGLTSAAVVYTVGENPADPTHPTYVTASRRSCRMPPAPV